jgi:hypothetical protein
MLDDAAFYEDPFGGNGFLVTNEPHRRVWIWWDAENRRMVQCVTYRVDSVLDQNAEDQVNNLNKKWGDGAIAARIPLSMYYEMIAPLRKEGDDKAIARILNDSDYSRLRTRSGTI